MIHPFDGVAFDGYHLAAIGAATEDVWMTCRMCNHPDANWTYEPSPSNLLEIIQTVRNHNVNCPVRRPTREDKP